MSTVLVNQNTPCTYLQHTYPEATCCHHWPPVCLSRTKSCFLVKYESENSQSEMYYIKHKGNVETAISFNGQVQCSRFEALQLLVYTHTETWSSEIFCSHNVLQICIAFNPKRAALEYQASPTQFSPSQLWKYLWLKIKMLLNEIFFFHMVNSLDFSVP